MRKSIALLLFPLLAGAVPAQGQEDGETSVPEPTHLYTVAVAAGSTLVWSQRLGEIESVDARATISVIAVEGYDGKRVRGMKLMLEDSMMTDQIYLPESLLSNLRDELEQLEDWHQVDRKCEAKELCIHGIARCRPSRTVSQAYCPSRYSKPNSEEGLILSTPHHMFMFPVVGTEQLSTLIIDAIQTLE